MTKNKQTLTEKKYQGTKYLTIPWSSFQGPDFLYRDTGDGFEVSGVGKMQQNLNNFLY